MHSPVLKGHLYKAVSCNKRSPFSYPDIENFIWIEPLLRGHLSYKVTFSLYQRWPLNTGLTVFFFLQIKFLSTGKESWYSNVLIKSNYWPVVADAPPQNLINQLLYYFHFPLKKRTKYHFKRKVEKINPVIADWSIGIQKNIFMDFLIKNETNTLNGKSCWIQI